MNPSRFSFTTLIAALLLLLAACGQQTAPQTQTVAHSSTVNTLSSSTVAFSNTDQINIPSFGAANPYPSSISVSGLSGKVTKVNVTLYTLNHQFFQDMDILLVGPTGQTLLLLSDVGGNGARTVTLTFDDAAGAIPVSNVTTGTYSPTNYYGFGTEGFPDSPSPSGPWGSTLSVFNGLNPNGIWKLYVYDDDGGSQGSLAQWSLIFTTAPNDNTAPIANPSISSGTQGSNGWYTSDVQVNWNWADEAGGSGIDSANCTTSSTSSGEGSINLSATCKDQAGNQGSASYTVNVDKTAPSLNPVVSPNPVLLNASASVVSNASDLGSGIANQSCGSISTSSVGTKSVSCNATDNAGNTATTSVNYQVIYNFKGFQQPVDNLPTLNQVKAGSSIPVKFSLSGNQGLGIFAVGSPSSQSMSCSSSATVDDVEQTVTAGNSTLQYDATTDTYTYIWKTEKAWANTCRQLNVKLVDGQTYSAGFKFK